MVGWKEREPGRCVSLISCSFLPVRCSSSTHVLSASSQRHTHARSLSVPLHGQALLHKGTSIMQATVMQAAEKSRSYEKRRSLKQASAQGRVIDCAITGSAPGSCAAPLVTGKQLVGKCILCVSHRRLRPFRSPRISLSP